MNVMEIDDCRRCPMTTDCGERGYIQSQILDFFRRFCLKDIWTRASSRGKHCTTNGTKSTLPCKKIEKVYLSIVTWIGKRSTMERCSLKYNKQHKRRKKEISIKTNKQACYNDKLWWEKYRYQEFIGNPRLPFVLCASIRWNSRRKNHFLRLTKFIANFKSSGDGRWLFILLLLLLLPIFVYIQMTDDHS